MTTSQPVTRGRVVPRAAGAVGVTVGGILVLMVSLLAGYGWLYALRGLHWFGAGPAAGDALPLLQLAGFDGQPVVRIVVAWLPAGLIAGVALLGVRPRRRVVLLGPAALVLLLAASQAAYALTRNLRFSDILLSRRPGLGPVLEAVVLTAGCALPRRRGRDRRGSRSRATRWSRQARPNRPGGRGSPDARGGPRDRRLQGVGKLGLRGGEHRHAGEHDPDRGHVHDVHGGAGPE